jgi:hypothetical protein
MEREICGAIAGKQRIAFDYNGSRHVVEPYVYGLLSDGTLALKARTLPGRETGWWEKPQWLFYDADRISELSVSSDRFEEARLTNNLMEGIVDSFCSITTG